MIVVVMGVSGVGKTTVAAALAQRLDVAFLECDELHPPANIEKMHAGKPLTDADRAPWLAAVAARLQQVSHSDRGAVAACSALKRAYRQQLRQACGEWRLVYLKAHPDEIRRRLIERTGHFMPAALLDSQLATLEEPRPDEQALVLDAQAPLETNLTIALSAISRSDPG